MGCGDCGCSNGGCSKTIDIGEPTTKDRVVLWFLGNKNRVLLGCLIGTVVAVGAFYLASLSAKGKRENVAKAAGLFLKWQNGGDAETFAKLMDEVKGNASLQQKYAAQIAQSLLNRNEVESALPLAEGLVSGESHFAHFARGSLMIAKGEYAEGLEEAKKLKHILDAKQDSLLYAYNLLRIASLEEQLGNAEGELLAWNEIEKRMVSSSRGDALLLENFTEQGLSLKDFIAYRKKVLTVGPAFP